MSNRNPYQATEALREKFKDPEFAKKHRIRSAEAGRKSQEKRRQMKEEIEMLRTQLHKEESEKIQ
jgi:hypothetical protein